MSAEKVDGKIKRKVKSIVVKLMKTKLYCKKRLCCIRARTKDSHAAVRASDLDTSEFEASSSDHRAHKMFYLRAHVRIRFAKLAAKAEYFVGRGR